MGALDERLRAGLAGAGITLPADFAPPPHRGPGPRPAPVEPPPGSDFITNLRYWRARLEHEIRGGSAAYRSWLHGDIIHSAVDGALRLRPVPAPVLAVRPERSGSIYRASIVAPTSVTEPPSKQTAEEVIERARRLAEERAQREAAERARRLAEARAAAARARRERRAREQDWQSQALNINS
jgi:hypothetical protein